MGCEEEKSEFHSEEEVTTCPLLFLLLLYLFDRLIVVCVIFSQQFIITSPKEEHPVTLMSPVKTKSKYYGEEARANFFGTFKKLDLTQNFHQDKSHAVGLS